MAYDDEWADEDEACAKCGASLVLPEFDDFGYMTTKDNWGGSDENGLDYCPRCWQEVMGQETLKFAERGSQGGSHTK